MAQPPHAGDTIVAVATPMGTGGIGVVRISGPRAWEVGRALFRPSRHPLPDPPPLRRMLYGHAVDPATGEVLDEVLCVFFAGPRSYTTEDTVEIQCHPAPAVLKRLVELAVALGCRPARAGEFTLRAFLGGRIDLSQAEAVARLVAARSKAEARVAMGLLEGGLGREIQQMRRQLVEVAAALEAAIDFPEDVPELAGAEAAGRIRAVAERARALAERGRALRVYAQGAVVVICGKPNVGKSSLFNALVGRERAIVTPTAGTTRDAIEDVAVLGGVACRLVDTAGLGVAAGEIEAIGMEVARRRLEAADGAIVVLDRSRPLDSHDQDVLEATRGMRRVVAVNKCDLAPAWEPDWELGGIEVVEISVASGQGLEELARAVGSTLAGGEPEPGAGEVVVGERHAQVLWEIAGSLERAAQALEEEAVEIASVELGHGLKQLGELDGQQAGDEVIEAIFEMFCVGK